MTKSPPATRAAIRQFSPPMIIRCPSCTTKFDLPASRFGADGTMIKCSVCGHDWLEGKAIDISREVTPVISGVAEPIYEPEHEIRRLVDATRQAHETFAARRRQKRIAAATWFGMALLGCSPAVYAYNFPDQVVRAAPAAISVYDWFGANVNIYGLDIRKVEIQHMQADGTRVLAIKGEITNISTAQRKIPWLRFALRTASRTEIYNWQLDTNARPLNPGESTSFVTRIASPPESAGEAEIRFAHADEIGSYSAP